LATGVGAGAGAACELNEEPGLGEAVAVVAGGCLAALLHRDAVVARRALGLTVVRWTVALRTGALRTVARFTVGRPGMPPPRR